MRSCAKTLWRMRSASSRSDQAGATASRWSRKPGRVRRPASSAPFMPAHGQCRYRSRPALADATPMSISSASSSKAPTRSCFSIPPELADFCGAAADRAGVASRDWESLARSSRCRGATGGRSDDIAYLQYSSGSTRFPHGVAVTHHALLDNLHAHGIGLQVATPTAWFPGCPGTTTWALSAACFRPSRCRCRSII